MNKKFKRRMVLAIILFISTGIVLIIAVKVQKILCDGIYSLAFTQDNQFFSESELSFWEEENIPFSYAVQVYPNVSNGVCSSDISVVATNKDYRYFSNMEMKTGGFFNESQINRKLKVAVVNTRAANQLFGNQNCLGEYVYLNQTPFQVIGIAKEKNDTGAEVYIPSQVWSELENSEFKIQQVWSEFGNVAEAALAISKVGHSMKEMDIVQVDLYKKVFRLRFCLIMIGFLLLALFKTRKMILCNEKRSIKGGFFWLLSLVEIISLIGILKFSWCVPAGYELIDDEGHIIFDSLLKFYTLADVRLSNMAFLTQWNIVSIIFFLISLLVIAV